MHLVSTITQYRRIYMITSFCKSMCNFSFRGRATKKEFVYFIAFWILLSFLFLTVILATAVTVLGLHFDVTQGFILPHQRANLFGLFVFTFLCITISVFIIFTIWSIISLSLLTIRRLHDMNYSGIGYWIWVSALFLLAVSETSVLTIFLIYFLIIGFVFLMFANSFPSANKYGKVDIDELVLIINKQNG